MFTVFVRSLDFGLVRGGREGNRWRELIRRIATVCGASSCATRLISTRRWRRRALCFDRISVSFFVSIIWVLGLYAMEYFCARPAHEYLLRRGGGVVHVAQLCRMQENQCGYIVLFCLFLFGIAWRHHSGSHEPRDSSRMCLP